MQRLVGRGVLQAKLTINRPGDVYEQEADRMADAVMRMPDSAAPVYPITGVSSPAGVQRACTCSGSSGVGECEECRSHAAGLQRSPTQGFEVSSVPANVHQTLRSSGQPLDTATRSRMEPRFGRDFSQVRVHTDALAAASALDVSARAYTVGNQIVFASGQYSPQVTAGQRLLAHELTHVVQQGANRLAPSLQRTCGKSAIHHKVAGHAGCNDNFDKTFFPGLPVFKFNVNCDDFAPKEKEALRRFVAGLPPAATLEIHGFASVDGPHDLNEDLGCARARAAFDVITTADPASGFAGISPTRITDVVNHGPVTSSSDPVANLRSVVIRAKSVRTFVTHHFRAAAWSFLSCAECNPFTDDGPLGISPPGTEPSLTSSFRQMHFIEAEIGTRDGKTIAPGSARLIGTGHHPGVSHWCGKSGLPFISGSHPGSPTPLPAGPHGEGIELESETVSRVGVTVPPTLPGIPIPGLPMIARGAPCGSLATSPAVPLIGNRFFMRLFADGSRESGFIGSTLYPSHFLYEDGVLKMFHGKPLHPAIDFFAWAASTGVPLAASIAGFKVLRFACCHPSILSAMCSTICLGGFTAPNPLPPSITPGIGGFNPANCLPLLAAIASPLSPCPTPCATAGGSCKPLVGPSNP